VEGTYFIVPQWDQANHFALCFEIAPFVFEGITVGAENAKKQTNISSLCLVVAPFAFFMKNQVAGLRRLRYTGSNYRPQKYCRGTERHSAQPI